MKKNFLVLLSLLCALLLLVGCGGEGASNNNNNNNNNSNNNNNENSGPQEPITITIGMPTSPRVLDYKSNSYTLWLEEQSGYNIEFVPYAYESADYRKQLSTETAAEQKLPDILWSFTLTEAEINQYGEDGYFIDLSEYFEDREKSANYWYMVEKYLSEAEQDKVWKLIHSENRDTTDSSAVAEGPIYAYPTLETTLIDTMNFMPMINQKWLDNLQLQAPTNLTELKEVLIAFRDRDPNGNNKKDEVPMMGSSTGLGSGLIEWIINFYIYYDENIYFNIGANDKLYLPHQTDAYRDALKYIRELIEEGLLHVNTLTYSYNSLRSVLQQSSDMVGVTVIHPTQGFNAESQAILKWEALDLYGDVYYNSNRFRKNVFVTDSCENPDAAWDLLMHMCTEESAIRLRYGEEGKTWDWADEGSTSIMGIPAVIKVYEDIWTTTNNDSWMLLSGGVFPYSENEQNQLTGQESESLSHKYDLYKALRANYDKALAKVDQSQVCPWLYFNEEENDIASNRVGLKSDLLVWQTYFLDGTKDIDNNTHWQEYLAALDKAGVQAYIDAGQHCYERMYK